MIRGMILGVLALTLGVVPGLNDSQRTRLGATGDRSPTVDEAGFYALLENASTWPADAATGSDVVFPDYNQLAAHPEQYRGKLCLLEGTLYQVLDLKLARTGWDKAGGITINVSTDPKQHRFVMVYLTNPPHFTWWKQSERLPEQHGSRVRILARFYKLVSDQTRGSATHPSIRKDFPVFVGQSLQYLTRSDTPTGPQFTLKTLGALLIGLAILGYIISRLLGVRRVFTDPPVRLDEFDKVRRERRESAMGEGDADDLGPDELPADPGAALDQLARRSEDQESEDPPATGS